MTRNTILLFVFVLTFLWHNANSQEMTIKKDSTFQKIQNLKEVTVYSTKELHHLKELPASVSLVSSEKINGNRILSIKDLSSFIPNLFMPDYGSKLTSPIYIRGIGSKINSPSVGLYVDGVPYFEKASFDFDFTDIQSIEILRGPQGTLYGRNTMGGIINIHTKMPDNFNGNSVYISAGNFKNKSFGASTYNSINNKLYYSFSANYIYNGGFFTNKFTDKKVDNIESYKLSTKLIYKPKHNVKSTLSISYQDSKQGAYPYAVIDKSINKVLPINYDHESSYNRDILSASLYNEFKMNNSIFTSSTSYNYFDDKQDVDQDFTAANIYVVNQTQKQHMISQEFALKSTNDNNYKWIIGTFGFYQSIDKNVSLDLMNKHYYTKTYDTPTLGAALFHQSTFMFGNFSLSAGIRLDYEHSKLNYTSSKKGDSNFDNSLEYVQFLPKLSAKYSFLTNNFIYSSISKGYKTGGFNSSIERKQDKTFSPEYSWNYEFGVKTSLIRNKLSANIAIFFTDWRDQQIYQSVPSGMGQMIKNANKSETKGAELELRAYPFSNFEINISYGYTKAIFKTYDKKIIKKDANGVTVKDANNKIVLETLNLTNNYIPFVPKQTLNIAISYKKEFKKIFIDAIKFNTQYKGTDKLYWNDINTFAQNYYFTLNTRISFIKGALSFDIWGKNISDSKYNAFYFSNSQLKKEYVQLGKPSLWGGTLKYSF